VSGNAIGSGTHASPRVAQLDLSRNHVVRHAHRRPDPGRLWRVPIGPLCARERGD
jgi:hypothetical protein